MSEQKTSVPAAMDYITGSAKRPEKVSDAIAALDRRLSKLEKQHKADRVIALDLATQRSALELCRLMEPKDPIGLGFERVGRDYDGGYVIAKHDASSRICYSLGINRDVSFDLEMANRGYDVFQYDHTIEKLPETHPRFHFRKLGISSRALGDDQIVSLPAAIESNGHGSEHNILLKMDIEGHEWEVFSDIDIHNLRRFSQITCEFHGFSKVPKLFWFRKAREALMRLNESHQVVHVHGNNNSAMVVLGGIALPQTLELTWLRRDICDFGPCTRLFPTPLDHPNNPAYADHHLGQFRFA